MRSLMLRPGYGNISRYFGDVFDDFMRFPVVQNETDYSWMPRVDIRESIDNVTLLFEIPGLKKEDIRVKVQENVLSVSGERKFEHEEKDGDYFHSEIRSGSFCRSFTLPDTVDSEKISADYQHGILEIKLDKVPEVKPKEIEIKVS